jgi:PAS domain S-box-containing protein
MADLALASNRGASLRRWQVTVHPLQSSGLARALIVLVDLTKEEQIARSLSRYRMLERATREALWELDLRTGEGWWNDLHYELIGCDPASTTPSVQAWADRIHPSDREMVLRKFHEIRESGATTYRDQYRYLRPDGRVGVMDDCGYIERDAEGNPTRMLGAMRDITDEREAERALRESEERFRQIAEAIREVFWLTDLETGRPLYVSPAFEAIWGRSIATLAHQPFVFIESIHPDDRPRVVDGVQRLLAGEEYEETYRVVRPDSSMIWVHDRATPIRDSRGKVVRASGVTTDVTAQRQLEEQLGFAQKMESMGRLASGIAHDFNNLLGVILACSSFAREKLPPDSDADADLEAVLTAGNRALELTSQLLAFARRVPHTTTTFDLNELLRKFEPLARLLLGGGVVLECRFDPHPSFINADPSQIEQVIANLAVNARDAMPHGGRLTIETSGTRVDARPDRTSIGLGQGEYVRLVVRDTGTGIPRELRYRIFEPFFTTKPAGEGSGLGLAISYRIVEQAGGRIAVVDSERGGGTCFEVLLPRAASEPVVAGPNEPTIQDLTVLFAEDDPALRAVGTRMLEKNGIRVMSASDGLEALRLALRHPGSIDVLVTDIVMPGMTGPELATKLQEERNGLRVVYTSGHPEPPDLPRGPDNVFLQKPYREGELLQVIRVII